MTKMRFPDNLHIEKEILNEEKALYGRADNRCYQTA
jgi:hypothetical protein